MDHSHFPVGIAVRTLLFGKIFAKFEDLGVVHVGDQVLRFFAELVDLIRLSQILNERILILVVLELDQPLDFVFACCILRLDCRKRYSSYSVVSYSNFCSYSCRRFSPLLFIGRIFCLGEDGWDFPSFQMLRCCKFPWSPDTLGYFVAQICYFSVDTELLRRSHCAENQLDVFITTVEVY